MFWFFSSNICSSVIGTRTSNSFDDITHYLRQIQTKFSKNLAGITSYLAKISIPAEGLRGSPDDFRRDIIAMMSRQCIAGSHGILDLLSLKVDFVSTCIFKSTIFLRTVISQDFSSYFSIVNLSFWRKSTIFFCALHFFKNQMFDCYCYQSHLY